MSAIAGIVRLDDIPLSTHSLQSMVDTLAHRGPNGANVWLDDNVGLGHLMCWTTPESVSEKLPRESANNVITADARLDNRDELLPLLAFNERPAQEISDSEIILAAYEKWGQSCVDRLLGDFVFAIWDKTTKKLFCARDQIGVKPFYYFQSHHIFAFATEIKALLCLPEVPREINELRIAYYLIDVAGDNEITFYRNIQRLPAAHSLTLQTSNKQKQIHRYWVLDPAPIRMKSDDDYAQAFRHIFTTAVAARLRSAFPIGSFLSGGLDSSSISCVAQTLLNKQHASLNTYSAIFPGLSPKELTNIDERKYVDAVISTGNFTSHFINADTIAPLSEHQQALWHLDEAFFAPNLHIHWAIYRQTNSNGGRVLLDGIDGDTVVSHGLEYFPELVYTGHWGRLFQEVSQYRENTHSTFSRSKFIWEHALMPLVSEHFLKPKTQDRWNDFPIRRDFAEHIHLVEHLREIEQKPVYATRKQHIQAVLSPIFPHFFEMADKASAAFSIEARYPFFDKRLVEFCVAIPASQKMSKGWTRSILRRAMQDILPHLVQWRPDKSNLSVNWRRAMNIYERPLFTKLLQEDLSIVNQYIDVTALKKTFQESAPESSIKEKHLFGLYKLLTLNTWLKAVKTQ